MAKVGRPQTDKPYRQNIVRVGVVEDILERVLEQVPQRSEAKKLIQSELSQFRLNETRKWNSRKKKKKTV